MTTALQIITKAMQKAGVLTKSEAPAADEAADALYALNSMIASWSNDSMLIYARTLENFPITANVAEYTIGPSQTFNTVRPLFIVNAYLRSGTYDYPISIITDENYDDILDKETQGTPEFLNYTNGFPTAKIKLWSTPNSNYTLYLLTEKQLTEFSSLSQEVSLPPGWERALVYNSAPEISGDYGQEVPQSVLKIAAESKAAIRKTIMKNRTMDANPPLTSGYNNVLTGWWR